MSRLTYHPRIPTKRHVVPSKIERMRNERWIVVNFAVDADAFMESLQMISDSLQRATEASVKASL